MPGPYDSRGKKVNEVKTYDVFGSHNYQSDYILLPPSFFCVSFLTRIRAATYVDPTIYFELTDQVDSSQRKQAEQYVT